MRSPFRPEAEPLARFVVVSVLVHLSLMLALPSSLLELGKRPARPEPEMPSETAVLTVMDIASEAFLAGNYSLAAEEQPTVVPDESREIQVVYSDTLNLLPVEVSEEGAVAREGAGAAVGAGRGAGGESEEGLRGVGRYEPPVPVIMMWPEYPASAKRKGIRGTVVVRVHVTAEGRVDQAEVVSGLTDEACRQSALEAARGLRFLPATLGGEAVDAWFSYPVEFGRTKR
ncbi:MAG: energy transducer TonB [Candidatus Eisenbacteria bacterium]|nr:energy transducer TonB [Candidatus Eisenbacteria bacterium]